MGILSAAGPSEAGGQGGQLTPTFAKNRAKSVNCRQILIKFWFLTPHFSVASDGPELYNSKWFLSFFFPSVFDLRLIFDTMLYFHEFLSSDYLQFRKVNVIPLVNKPYVNWVLNWLQLKLILRIYNFGNLFFLQVHPQKMGQILSSGKMKSGFVSSSVEYARLLHGSGLS